jgi:hypothetical protein
MGVEDMLKVVGAPVNELRLVGITWMIRMIQIEVKGVSYIVLELTLKLRRWRRSRRDVRHEPRFAKSPDDSKMSFDRTPSATIIRYRLSSPKLT